MKTCQCIHYMRWECKYHVAFTPNKCRKNIVGVHGFKGSGVQGSILVPGLHLGCVFTRKASASSGLLQNLEPNWQLFGKISIFDEDFGSLMPSLSLTVSKIPLGGEPVNGYKIYLGYYKNMVEIYISLTVQTEEIKYRRGAEN